MVYREEVPFVHLPSERMNINERPPHHTTHPQLSPRRQMALFARNFFKHPKMLGSIIPSSPYLVRRMLNHVDWQRAEVLVEYGPGVGTFTKEILRQMRPDAVLIVLETNGDFVDYLQQAYPDPRLQVVLVRSQARELLDVVGVPRVAPLQQNGQVGLCCGAALGE